MAIRLLHLADLHLGSTGGLEGEAGNTRRQDLNKALDAAVDFARASATRVDAVLVCGDLFDTHRPVPDLIDLVRSRFESLREDGIPVLLVPGFHDAWVYPDCVYRTTSLGGAQVLLTPQKPVTLELRSTPVHFYGCAWLSRQSGLGSGLVRQELPGFHVGLLHGDLQAPESVPFRFKLSELEATALDYVALGCRHTYVELETRGPVVAYAGALEEAGGALLTVSLSLAEGQRQVSLARTPYSGRPLLEETVDLTPMELPGGTAGLAAFLVRYADVSAICRMELTGTVPFVIDLEALRNLLNRHFFHLELTDRTRFSQAPVIPRLETENTVRGRYTRQVMAALRKGDDEVLLEYALKAVLKPCLEEELL